MLIVSGMFRVSADIPGTAPPAAPAGSLMPSRVGFACFPRGPAERPREAKLANKIAAFLRSLAGHLLPEIKE
jgi:hypothetical protein